jgi:hypothetical protein
MIKASYRRAFSGTSTVQAEALPPDVLAAIVRDAIRERVDREAYNEVLGAEERVKRELDKELVPLLRYFPDRRRKLNAIRLDAAAARKRRGPFRPGEAARFVKPHRQGERLCLPGFGEHRSFLVQRQTLVCREAGKASGLAQDNPPTDRGRGIRRCRAVADSRPATGRSCPERHARHATASDGAHSLRGSAVLVWTADQGFRAAKAA